MVGLFPKPFTAGALHVEGLHLVEAAMELQYVLSAKDKVALSQQDMAITFPVQHVISLEDAKSAKVQGNAYVQVLISLDTYQVRTPFMEQMEELSLPIALEVVAVLLVLRPLARHHILQGEHVQNVVVEDMKAPHISMLRHQVPDGLNLITIQAVPHVLIVITKQTTITTHALNVEGLDITNFNH